MGTRDPRIDAYIAKSAEFARPILTYLRDTIHTAVPDVQETTKWSMPYFDYNGPLCGMASFKAHCAFNFWKASILFERNETSNEAMGQFGRITSIKDLPPKKELVRLIKEAARLNEEGVKVPARRGPRPAVETPDDLAAALSENRKARAAFEAFPPSHRREYIEWINEAKTAPTRQRRLEQAVEWMAEGKSRNWKYEKK